MLKIAALLFNTFALLIYQLFFADVVTITPNIPTTSKCETEFIVELTINKGASGGFAKLQQELPVGFTAIEDKNNGASFTFSNQSVKLIWMALPADKEFKVSYKVSVAAGTTGDKIIAGKFSFVADNVKQTVPIAPATITVTCPGSQPAVATNTPTTPVTPPAPTPPIAPPPIAPPVSPPTTPVTPPASIPGIITDASGAEIIIHCIRTTPENAKSPSEFPVEVTITKGNLNGFAKYTESLPVGFSVTVIEAKGAAFSFVDQKAKFVWGTLPSEKEFKISYKITVAPNVNADQVIEGSFAFLNPVTQQTNKVIPQPASIKTGASEITSQPIASGTTPTTPVKPTATPAVTPTAVTSAPAEPTTTASNTKPTTAPTPVAPTTTASTTKPKNEKPAKVAKELSASSIPSPQGKAYYKVQILALHRQKTEAVVASLFNITETIEPEMEEGFRKYRVGTHNEYKEARDHREQIPKAVIAPFVVAFNSGKHITVQEALMITSQKWFR